MSNLGFVYDILGKKEVEYKMMNIGCKTTQIRRKDKNNNVRMKQLGLISNVNIETVSLN